MPEETTPQLDIGGFTLSGAIAGALSAFVFSVIHYFLISPIWFAMVANIIAGAVSGTCIAWSYSLAVRDKTRWSWASYNVAFVLILAALCVTSLIMFEPVTTIPALLRSKEPPRALIGQALPVTLVFTLASAALLSLRYRAGLIASAAIGITAFVVVFFLGLNLSILGLVSVPRGSLYLLAEVFLLILALAGFYAGSMTILYFRQVHRRGT